MLQKEKQGDQAKKNVKSAWEEGDLLKLLLAGVDNALDLLCGGVPIPFQRFLEDTGAFFDRYVEEVGRKECLRFIGGKLTLTLDRPLKRDTVPIALAADFYFQTADKKWGVKKKNGMVESSRFTDWTTDPEAVKLMTAGKMELAIEPPEEKQ